MGNNRTKRSVYIDPDDFTESQWTEMYYSSDYAAHILKAETRRKAPNQIHCTRKNVLDLAADCRERAQYIRDGNLGIEG